MADKKKTSKKTPKAKTKGKEKPKKSKALEKIQNDLMQNLHCTMFDDEWDDSIHKILALEKAGDSNRYEKVISVTCDDCDSTFDHKASLSPLEVELDCPKCKKVHLIRISPTTKYVAIESETLTVDDGED